MSPAKRKATVRYFVEAHEVSERRACRALNVNRTGYRYEPVKQADEDAVRADIIYKACNFGRVGYRMVYNMMRNEGRQINHKRVERIWREEVLKLPQKQQKRRRLWLTSACVQSVKTMFGVMILWKTDLSAAEKSAS